MGGRGARFGISTKGKPYGTEYRTVLQVGRIKFVKKIDDRPAGKKKLKPQSTNAPMETMTKGRVYVTVDGAGKLGTVTFYSKGKRIRQIDLDHKHNGWMPHMHKGYFHDENGTRKLTRQEQNLVDSIYQAWYNKNST